MLKTAGQQLDGFGQLQDDGSTMCGNWLHVGLSTPRPATTTQRRSTDDPTGLGMYPQLGLLLARQPARHVQPRVGGRARASPGIRRASGIKWNGEKWVGDVPDIKPDSPPGEFGAFIMTAGGRRPALRRRLNDGPFPEHYEAVEAPVDNLLHPKVTSNPAAKKFKSDKDVYGTRDDFPIVCTTYRLTEQYHYWTKHIRSAEPAAARLLRRDPGGAGEGEGHRQRRRRRG